MSFPILFPQSGVDATKKPKKNPEVKASRR